MKIVRKMEALVEKRSDGRTVRKLLEHSFQKPVDSIAVYLCDVPGSQFGKHYHAKSEEFIIFPVGGKITVNGKDYNMEPWDLVVLMPGDVHSYERKDRDIIHLAVRCPDIDDKKTE